MDVAQTRPASRIFFPDAPPVGDEREWIMRGANFVVIYNEVDAGTTVERLSDDEYMIYFPDSAAIVAAGGATLTCPPGSLAIVPPGQSRIAATAAGKMVRVFTAAAYDLVTRASNAGVYEDGAPEVGSLAPWPAPPEGLKLRGYRLADYADKPMRLFRSSNMMLNIFDFVGPRDPEALSPHSHEGFEQGSFGLAGEWVHSLRYPWSPRLSQWRDDEHLRIGSPPLVVIPAGVIRTSRAVSEGPNQLLDIFAPPRPDFVAMGLVCNEQDYPPQEPEQPH